jgi:hypothetical protein
VWRWSASSPSTRGGGRPQALGRREGGRPQAPGGRWPASSPGQGCPVAFAEAPGIACCGVWHGAGANQQRVRRERCAAATCRVFFRHIGVSLCFVVNKLTYYPPPPVTPYCFLSCPPKGGTGRSRWPQDRPMRLAGAKPAMSRVSRWLPACSPALLLPTAFTPPSPRLNLGGAPAALRVRKLQLCGVYNYNWECPSLHRVCSRSAATARPHHWGASLLVWDAVQHGTAVLHKCKVVALSKARSEQLQSTR